MSKIDQLLKNYRRHISIPWQRAAPAQRVIFCIYNENNERRLRLKIDEFELATRNRDTVGQFLTLLIPLQTGLQSSVMPLNTSGSLIFYPCFCPALTYIIQQFTCFLEEKAVDEQTVVALQGAGSLFGLLKVKEVVDHLAPLVFGRLLVFFPGSYEQNNYRLLDGYDGWNYLAVPLTANKEF